MTPGDSLCSFWTTLLSWLFSLLGRIAGRTPVEPEPQPKKAWTFMVYIAGDNSLEEAGQKDLGEMKAAGSTDDVNIVAQFDGASDQVCRRYYIRPEGTLEDDIVALLPEVNTGDASSLLDFLTWVKEHYPAEHYALILWNHGTGWKDEDIYHGLQTKGLDAHDLTRGQMRSLISGNSGRALFRSSVVALAADVALKGRAILFDDTSADFLDNVEMKSVLDDAALHFGQRIDLLGCDACLMSMLEVAYQLKGSCHYFVASQEEEPGDGWPYDAILNRLVGKPSTPPDLLAATIVEEYNRFYRDRYPNLPVTQAALDLDRLDGLAFAVDELADSLLAVFESDRQRGNALISLALYDVQKFTDRDYVDLAHFCGLLAEQDPGTTIASAAQGALDRIQCDRDTSPLVAEGHSGPGMRHANGISIYLPERIFSPLYERLEFAKEHRWDEFLKAKLAPRSR